jgi:arylsulfatase B
MEENKPGSRHPKNNTLYLDYSQNSKFTMMRFLPPYLQQRLLLLVCICIISPSVILAKAPHILFLLVDDLGWGDVGFHRSTSTSTSSTSTMSTSTSSNTPNEIQTPNMDRLAAKEGIILNRHYVHSSCTGTRTSLQSGRLPVHVQTSLKNPEDPSSGMPRNMTGLAEHLRHQAHYRTHYVGKWDVGMATPKHTPYGRGYETSLHYFEHKNDYWTQNCMQSACCPNYHSTTTTTATANPTSTSAAWEGPNPESHFNLTLADLWDTDKPARDLNGTDYEEFIFLRRMNEIIANHSSNSNDNINEVDEPLFLLYAPHVAHCPLQVPEAYLDKFDFMTNDSEYCQAQTENILPKKDTQPKTFSCRKQYHAMVNLLDDILGQLVEQLKAQDMWENTLLVFTSDNGGPIHLEESGSTNFDLRGGKYSDWEGGVRATAFVSGGYLAEHRRGITVQEPIHIADWYATLPAIAGIATVQDPNPNLPPIDALNVWPLLSGQTDVSPRQEIPLSYHSLIQGDYKLIWQDEVQESGWTGPYYPNASSTPDDIRLTMNCANGCLYNLARDRGEHEDMAKQEPVRVQAMKQRLIELRKGFYENDDKGLDSCPPDIDMPCACWMGINYYGGFLGPYQEVNISMGAKSDEATA